DLRHQRIAIDDRTRLAFDAWNVNAVDISELRLLLERSKGAPHRQETCAENVDLVDLLHARLTDADSNRIAHDERIEVLAHLLGKHFRIGDALRNAGDIDDDGGGDHGARERPASCLVDTGDAGGR